MLNLSLYLLTYIDAGVRVSSLWIVSLYFVPSVERLRYKPIKIERRRIECLQVALLLSKSSKNVHLVPSHTGRVRISLLRSYET